MAKYWLLAAITGFLLALAWPTIGFPGFLFVAFVPLLFCEHKISESNIKRKALLIFGLSYLSFLLWNVLVYPWLSQAHPRINPTTSELNQAWFAFGAATTLNALFMAVVFTAYHKIKNSTGILYGLVFLPAFWMSFEKLHLNWDFSWPWLNLGNGFASYYKWIQWYEFTGTFGGTLWIWIANFVAFYALMAYVNGHGKKLSSQYGLGFLCIVLLPIAYSYQIYFDIEDNEQESITVTVLQPKVNPYKEKYESGRNKLVTDLLNLAEESTIESDFVLGPETAFPGDDKIIISERESDASLLQVRNWQKKHPKSIFVSGVEMINFEYAPQVIHPSAIDVGKGYFANIYNSAIQVEPNSTSIPVSHKSKLVIGVELFPYPGVLKPLLGSLMLDFGGSTNGLTRQDSAVVFSNQLNSALVAPSICYESIYGEYTAKFIKKGANVIFISTNDSWWGDNEGHKQLLEYARLRAIENRRAIARSANSGVSAFFNKKGDLLAALPYDNKGVQTHQLSLNNDLTFYTTHGDWLASLALLLSGIILAYSIAQVILKKWQ